MIHPGVLQKVFTCNKCKVEQPIENRVSAHDLQQRNECRACCSARCKARRDRIKKDREQYGY